MSKDNQIKVPAEVESAPAEAIADGNLFCGECGTGLEHEIDGLDCRVSPCESCLREHLGEGVEEGKLQAKEMPYDAAVKLAEGIRGWAEGQPNPLHDHMLFVADQVAAFTTCPPHVWVKRDEMPMGGAAWQVTCDQRAQHEPGFVGPLPVHGARPATTVPPTVWVETGPHIQPGEITVYVNNDAATALGRVSDGFVAPVKGDPTKSARIIPALPPEVHVTWTSLGPWAAFVDGLEARAAADAVEGGMVMVMRLRGGLAPPEHEKQECTECHWCDLTTPRRCVELLRERDEARAATEAIKTDKNDLVEALTKANNVIEQADDFLRPLLVFLPGQSLVSTANTVAGHFRSNEDTLKAARGTLREALDTTEPLSVSELAGLAALRLRDYQQDRDRARADCTEVQRLLVEQIGAHDPEAVVNTAKRAAELLSTWMKAGAGAGDDAKDACDSCRFKALGTCAEWLHADWCGDWKPITPDPVGDAQAPILLAHVAKALGHDDPTPAELLGLADEVREMVEGLQRKKDKILNDRIAGCYVCDKGEADAARVKELESEIAGLLARSGDVDDERQRWRARYEMAERCRLEAEELVKSFGDERDALKAKLDEYRRFRLALIKLSRVRVAVPAVSFAALGEGIRMEEAVFWRDIGALFDSFVESAADDCEECKTRSADEDDADCAECEKAMEEMRATLATAQQERAAAIDLSDRAVNHAGDAIRERNEAREALALASDTTCPACDGTGWVTSGGEGDLCRCPLGETLGRAHHENEWLRRDLASTAAAATRFRYVCLALVMEGLGCEVSRAQARDALDDPTLPAEHSPWMPRAVKERQSGIAKAHATKRPMAKAGDKVTAWLYEATDGIKENGVSPRGLVALRLAVIAMDERERREAHDQDLILRRLELVERFLDRDLAGWNADDAPGPLAGFVKMQEHVGLINAVTRLGETVADLERRPYLTDKGWAKGTPVKGMDAGSDQSGRVVIESDGRRREYDVCGVEVTCVGVKVDLCGDGQ
jgi:hypothetical protein